MGCRISKLEESDAVLQCKTRRAELQEAVKSRQDLALAHLSYLESLRSVGSALRLLAGDNGDSDPVLTLISTSPLTTEEASSPPSSSPNIVPPVVLSQPHLSSSLSSSSSSPLSSTSSPPICPPPPAPLHTTKQTPPVVNSSPSPLDTIPSTQLPNLSPFSSMENIQTSPKSPRNSPPYSCMTTRESYFSASASPTPSLSLIPANFPHHKSEWDYFNFFEPPPVPFHHQEQPAMKQVELEESRDTLNPDRDLDEAIPALEEEDKQEDSAEYDKEKGDELQANNASVIDSEVSPSSQEKSMPGDDQDMISKTASELNSLVSFADDGIIKKKNLSVEEEKVLTVITTFEELNLREVARRVNDQFIRAYNSGKDVMSMLESQKVDHRSTFSSLRDSVKVLNVIKWHQPSKLALVWTDEISDNEMVEGGIAGSHASTLERLCAWEKKLFDEVKAGENIRLHFERKCKELQVLDAKGRDRNKIDKTRAMLRNLDSQLIVALRAVNSASQRIQTVTNDELFPQMEMIIYGLVKMWRVMLECHQTQKSITLDLTSLEESSLMGEANEENWRATMKLEYELMKFRDCFRRWISAQRVYIDALHAWLRACHMCPEKDSKGRIVSSYPSFEPPILPLTIKWKQALKQLQPRMETVNNAIDSFAAALQSLQAEQQEEINRRKRREGNGLNEESNHKMNPLRYFEKKVDGDLSDREPLMVDEQKSGVEKHSNKSIQERRIKSTLSSLRATLPVVFDALAAFANSCLEEYESLRQDAEKNSFHHLENSNGNLSEPFMNRY